MWGGDRDLSIEIKDSTLVSAPNNVAFELGTMGEYEQTLIYYLKIENQQKFIGY